MRCVGVGLGWVGGAFAAPTHACLAALNIEPQAGQSPRIRLICGNSDWPNKISVENAAKAARKIEPQAGQSPRIGLISEALRNQISAENAATAARHIMYGFDSTSDGSPGLESPWRVQ